MNVEYMIQIKTKNVAHSTPDFSSNAVTLSSVLPKIKFTLKVRFSSDGSFMWTLKLPNYVQPSSSVYCGHSVVDWNTGNDTLLWNGFIVLNSSVILAPSSTTDPLFM